MRRQTNLLWKGGQYDSLENCVITEGKTAREVRSVLVGMADGTPYSLTYRITTNQVWETTQVELAVQVSDKREFHFYESNIKGRWTKDGAIQNKLNDCVDIDISLTPFTNTLAINRLQLGLNQSREITVLYFDILQKKVMRVLQKYTRQSDTQYKFENVPNDFEAIIKVDEDGLVVDYPGLFTRVYKRERSYNHAT